MVLQVFKGKKRTMVQSLESADLYATSYDMVIDRGSSGKDRLDAVFDVGTHLVILECDTQKQSHDERECE